MDKNEPKDSETQNQNAGVSQPQISQEDDTNSKEITNYLLDQNCQSTSSFMVSTEDYCSRSKTYAETTRSHVPLLLISRQSSFEPITTQPQSNQSQIPTPQGPQPLFIQALAKLNESSVNLSLLRTLQTQYRQIVAPTELSPPSSLTSAPPSYSFVLRQMDVRRRPRLMGTFIPSPSFVQHTPPPHYASAFDVYVDNNPMPRQQVRVLTFGFTSMPAVCPECGFTGMTRTISKITLCTHLCAFVLCLMCCWPCVPLPYVTKSCKDVYHYCRGCRHLLGMYSPTNPENPYA